MDRVKFTDLDTICGLHQYKPVTVVVPMLPPKPKPKASDYKPKLRTRHGKAPRLQHLNILRWMADSAGTWFAADDFLDQWAIQKKHLARIIGQLRSCRLIESIKNPRKKGNARLYRITHHGADIADVGLDALQLVIYQEYKKHV